LGLTTTDILRNKRHPHERRIQTYLTPLSCPAKSRETLVPSLHNNLDGLFIDERSRLGTEISRCWRNAVSECHGYLDQNKHALALAEALQNAPT
jgi:hypothetical protein